MTVDCEESLSTPRPTLALPRAERSSAKYVHTMSVLADHSAQPRLHILFLAHAPLGPLNGDVVIAGKGLDPLLVVSGPLAQNLFANDRNADNAAEEVHDLLGP
jgi:hypothetical protein